MMIKVLCLAVLALLGTNNANADHYDLQPGETVWTEGGSEGTVEAIFPDGRVSIKVGYGNYTYARAALARQGCYRQLCSNQGVVTRGGSEGYVNGFFPRGAVSIKVGYGNYTYNYADLAPTNPPYNPNPPPYEPGIEIGDIVWTRGGSEGSVNGIFPNGEISIKVGYGNYRYQRRDLAIRGCVYDICSGDNVVTRAGSHGQVNGVFPTREVSVKVGYGNYLYPYQDLARTRD